MANSEYKDEYAHSLPLRALFGSRKLGWGVGGTHQSGPRDNRKGLHKRTLCVRADCAHVLRELTARVAHVGLLAHTERRVPYTTTAADQDRH